MSNAENPGQPSQPEKTMCWVCEEPIEGIVYRSPPDMAPICQRCDDQVRAAFSTGHEYR